ncbi:MAG TPA: hypothetical protein ENJ45_00795 [Phaeodactylibacter sp.]|nr:hypothetical protein [Phaeodactylibacter sp.]
MNPESSFSYNALYPLDFNEPVRLPLQMRTFFLKALRRRLQAEGHSKYFDDYVNRFYDSPFLKSFDAAAAKMVEHCYLLHADNDPTASAEIDAYLGNAFDEWIDRFLTETDLHYSNGSSMDSHNPNTYNDALAPAHPELRDKILSVLLLDEEREKSYTDLSEMPLLKLKNARESFLFAEPSEQVFFISDQSIFGSCRIGFAMTNRALYWKVHFHKAQKVFYFEIDSLQLDKEWLLINGKFFNANPAMNVKMMRLLEMLREGV